MRPPLILHATLIGILNAQAQTIPARQIADPESYDVYAAVLRLDQHAPELSSIYLRETTFTNTHSGCMPTADALPSVWRDVLADYNSATSSPHDWWRA